MHGGASDEGGPVPRTRRSHRRRLAVGLAALVVLVTAGLAVRGHLDDVATDLADVRWPWMLAAVAGGVTALTLYSAVRLVLVRAAGGHTSLVDMVGLTYATGAIASSVPAGGPIATAYAYGQYRGTGADEGSSAWALLVNGVVTPGVLGALGLLAVVIAAPSGPAAVLVPVGLAAAFVAVAAVVLRRPHALEGVLAGAIGVVQRVRHRPTEDTRAAAAAVLAQFAAVRLPRRSLALALTAQVGSWLADIAVLCAAMTAVGQPVPWRALLAVYTAAQLVGLVPILPAGIGQIETGLVVGLGAAGFPLAPALAATVAYRLASQWIVVPIGWACWGWRRRRARTEGRAGGRAGRAAAATAADASADAVAAEPVAGS